MPKPRISIIIPTIEEEGAFGVISEIRKLLGNGVEIIVVDKSGEKYYKRLLKTGVIVIRQKDRGVENAIMLGLRKAHGNILGSIDADGTHEALGLRKGVKMIENGEADLVLGNRFYKLGKDSMSPYLDFGNTALSLLFTVLYGTGVRDVLTGLFVMRRKAFNDIKNVRPYRAGIAFIVIELVKRGYRIKEVGIRYSKRRYGTSKITKSKLGYGFTVGSNIISHRF